MLKILYIVGTGSKYSDIELRWSLRSVEKFAQCDVQPVVVGSVPDWFKGDALSCPDKFERKEKNLNHKIMTAIRGGLVQGEFQISADDHFWLKPIDFEKLPVYYRGGLLPKEAAKGDNNYAKALVGTGITLGKFLHPKWNTACHRNAWASADDIDKVKSLIDFANYRNDYAGLYGMVAWATWPNVLLGNRISASKHGMKQITDLKYRGEDGFKTFIEDAEVFSINDKAFGSNGFISFMQENFKNPSRWEK